MRKQIILFLLLLLFFSGASAYVMDRHLIQVNVLDDSRAKVTEKYFIVFKNAIELSNFRKKALENGSSMELWNVFDSNIATHIDSIKGGTGRVIFEDKQTERVVALEYETLEPFMIKKSETSRKIFWALNPGVFTSFEFGSVYVIPGNTDISVILPKNAVLAADSIVPTAVVSGNIVSWSGPINVSGKLVLDYSTEKQIGPTVSISRALQELSTSTAMPIIGIAILVVLGLVYWKRKALGGKIEGYVVEHSKIESKPGSEEEDLE